MLGDKNDAVGRRYIGTLKDAGYDYMELPLAQIMELSENSFSELAEEAEKTGLPCECCNNFFPASVRLTGETVDPAKVQEYVKRARDRAVKLGSRVIVFGSSGAKNVPEGFPYDRAFGQIADALRMIDTYAASAGIHIAIEPLNRQESNIIQNLEEGKKLMTEAGGPSIRLLADYYHFMLEKESLETLKKRIPDIVHVHFADPDGRSFPKESRKEYEDFFAVLKEGGYDGRVSIEAYSENKEKEISGAVFIRKYF